MDKNNCDTEELKPYMVKECPSVGFAGITGDVIGGASDFVQSKSGLSLIFVVLIVGAFVIVIFSKKN